MHDLEAHFPDGSWAAIEVTSAENKRLAAEFGAVRGDRAFVYDDRLQSGWWAALREGARVTQARRHLPDALVAMEAAGLSEFSTYGGGTGDDTEALTQLLYRAHVRMVREAPELGPGRAALLVSGQSGWMNTEPDGVVDFVESFVERRTSDVAKLAASGANERHLFIWSGWQGTRSSARPGHYAGRAWLS